MPVRVPATSALLPHRSRHCSAGRRWPRALSTGTRPLSSALGEPTEPAAAAEHITLQVDAATGIARLTLTNTRRTNPLSLGLMLHATQLLRDQVAPSSDVRALVLAAEPGAKFFSSGHDLGDVFVRQGKTSVAARSEAELRALFGACSELMLVLRNLPQPTLAVVDGTAASAGLQLAAACDIVLASSDAMFVAPGSRRGRFCHTPGVGLAERVGPSRALEFLLLGEAWSAEQDLTFGLVTKVFPAAELHAGAQAVAESLSVGVSAPGLAHGKRALREHALLPDLADKYRSAEAHMAAAMATADAVEGTRSMLERRPGVYS